MPSKTVTVGSSVGLHARPAAIISEAAGELDSEVTLAVPGEEPVDASLLAADHDPRRACGDTVEVAGDDQAARRHDRRPGREGPRRLTAVLARHALAGRRGRRCVSASGDQREGEVDRPHPDGPLELTGDAAEELLRGRSRR